MPNQHEELIKKFYTAFQEKDAEGMIACYHQEVIFQDPVFGELNAKDARNMWRMLIQNGGEDLTVTFSDLKSKGTEGKGKWEAKYVFGKEKRKVHNKISSQFIFKEEKIYRHIDTFSFWRWSRMALGMPGFFLGFTPILKNKVRESSLKLLKRFGEENPEIENPT